MQATTPTTTTTTDDDRTDSNPFRDALVQTTNGDVVFDPSAGLDRYQVIVESRHDRPLGSDDYVQEVRVLPNDHKFVGTFVQQSGLDYYVEDTRGFERVVRPYQDGVTVVDVDEERRSRGQSL